MAKKFGKSLDEALLESDAAEVVRGEDTGPEAQPKRTDAIAGRAAERALPIVPLTIHVDREDRKRLRRLSIDADMSLQQLGISAWNLLLESRGLPPLKPAKANVPDGRRRRPNGTAGT